MTTKKIYRQGDILLISEEQIPTTSIRRKDNIIARGEHSGHTHQFSALAPVSVFIDSSSTVQHVHIEQQAILEHDTHENLEIPAGEYEIRQERELDLVGEVRKVAD